MLKSKLTGAVVVHGLLFIAVANGPESKPALQLVKQGTIRFSEDSTSPVNSASFTNSVPMPLAPEIKLNPKGVQYVKNYMKVMGEELDLVKSRSEKLFIMMDTILAKYNL